ncbi:serine hydrolase [Falsibacillus albus]|uniref:Serine hydrolase n=1 Tax=Falsibacillus albus TaxID=2478915 RepID=A0A3L7JVM8_9BACI|nr:serine hydrolase [Falsibacillus albus]RLQ94304.1 serine hydrolase [Falsibacillus albus]
MRTILLPAIYTIRRLPAAKIILKSRQANKMNFNDLEREIMGIEAGCAGRIGLFISADEGQIMTNEGESFPSASLIKLPIILEAFRQADARKLDLNERIMVHPEEKVGGAGVLPALSDNITFNIIDLMTLMIIVSDNTATNLVIDKIGMKSINQLISCLDLKETLLSRKMMDFDAIHQGRNNYTSPRDIVTLLKEIHHGEMLNEKSRQQIIGIMRQQQFTDKLPALVESDKIRIANKTGELDGVDHDCAIFEYGGKTVFAAVLIDGLVDKVSGKYTMNQIGCAITDYLLRQ